MKSNEGEQLESDNGVFGAEKVRRENERKTKACEEEAAFLALFFFSFLRSQNKKINLDFKFEILFLIKLDLIIFLFIYMAFKFRSFRTNQI